MAQSGLRYSFIIFRWHLPKVKYFPKQFRKCWRLRTGAMTNGRSLHLSHSEVSERHSRCLGKAIFRPPEKAVVYKQSRDG